MVDRTMWSGTASELLRLCAESARDEISRGAAWARNPRALAGRLRRAQTFLRTLGIEITFSREGRTGTRMINVSTNSEVSVSTVSRVSAPQGWVSRQSTCGDQRIKNSRAGNTDGAHANATVVWRDDQQQADSAGLNVNTT
jgi:hypothetical protein